MPLPSSHHPLQETRRPINRNNFYHPGSVEPRGSSRWLGDVTSSLQPRFGCGLPGACSSGIFPRELPAQQWLACPGMPHLLPSPVLPLLDHFPPSHSCQGPAALPARPPDLGSATALNTAPRAPRELPSIRLSSGSLPQFQSCFFFPPSTILLRFLTFKPVCQLLCSVLAGSCWLNPWAQR